MTVNTPGSSHTERVDLRTVLRVKAATFAEQRKREGMPGGLEEDKAGVCVEPSKNSNQGEI